MSEQEKEFRDCLYYVTNALSRRLSQMAEEAFRELGMSSSHAFLLMSVNRSPGIQPGALSKKLQLNPSTITRLIEKMEHQGLLERQSEGRATHVEPTQKCLDLDERLYDAWQSLIKRYTALLGERYTRVLTEMAHTGLERIDEREEQ